MNLKYIHYNLEEAQEEIENILQQLKRGENYNHAEFYSSMQHLIHHINIAWNSRGTTAEQTSDASEEDLLKWSRYPTDIKLI